MEEERIMNIKLIAVDLDGTLLRDDKTISKRNIETLKKCRERGIKVVYATARGKSAPLIVPADILDGQVQMNGALAIAGNEIIHQKKFSITEVRDFLVEADNAGIDIAVEDMAASCLEYAPILDCKYSIDRIDEMANGQWVSVITSSVNKKPYFTTSYFTFKDGKIIDLVEYYGDFGD